MSKTKIQWTDKTWNLTSGCKKVSDGCKNCYAEVMHNRLTAMKSPKYLKPFSEFQMHESEINKIPSGKGKMVFINSMSDFFHDDMEINFIDKVLAKIDANPDNIYQVLTKRSENIYEKLYGQDENKEYLMRELGGNNFINNLWIGVTVENKATRKRIKDLVNPNIVSRVKFLSIEPLLEDLELTVSELKGIDWVIVGGESGKNSRPINKEWVEAIQRTCKEAEVPFFFKQWGGVNKKESGRILNGRIYDEMPTEFNNIKFSEYFNYLKELELNEDVVNSRQICNLILREMLPVINDLVIHEDKNNPLQVCFELKNETIFNLTGLKYDIEYDHNTANVIVHRIEGQNVLESQEIHIERIYEYMKDFYYTLESPAVSVKLSRYDMFKMEIKNFNLPADLTNRSLKLLSIIDSTGLFENMADDLEIIFIDKVDTFIQEDTGVSFIIDNTEKEDFIAFKIMQKNLEVKYINSLGVLECRDFIDKKQILNYLNSYYE